MTDRCRDRSALFRRARIVTTPAGWYQPVQFSHVSDERIDAEHTNVALTHMPTTLTELLI